MATRTKVNNSKAELGITINQKLGSVSSQKYELLYTCYYKNLTWQVHNTMQLQANGKSEMLLHGLQRDMSFNNALFLQCSCEKVHFTKSASSWLGYLGKVVHDMATLIFDGRHRRCYTAMVNNFYVHWTFEKLLITCEATGLLPQTLPYSYSSSDIDPRKKEEGIKLSHDRWPLYTLHNRCHLLEYFVNSSMLLSPTSASQTELFVQPCTAGLSIGLFLVPRDPKVFESLLQSQI